MCGGEGEGEREGGGGGAVTCVAIIKMWFGRLRPRLQLPNSPSFRL